MNSSHEGPGERLLRRSNAPRANEAFASKGDCAVILQISPHISFEYRNSATDLWRYEMVELMSFISLEDNKSLLSSAPFLVPSILEVRLFFSGIVFMYLNKPTTATSDPSFSSLANRESLNWIQGLRLKSRPIFRPSGCVRKHECRKFVGRANRIPSTNDLKGFGCLDLIQSVHLPEHTLIEVFEIGRK